MRTSKPPKSLPFIDYFRIPHNTLYLRSNCARVIVFKCSQENAVLPGAFKNNGLRHFWGGEGGGGKHCIMGDQKIENREKEIPSFLSYLKVIGIGQSRELPLCGQVLYRLSTHGFLQLQTWTVRENPSTALKRAP